MIYTLFANGAQGGWWDPSDFSTMSQDSDGETPVTAVGQPVGRILDKSGNALHRTQATAASRLTLQQDAAGYYYLEYDGVDDWNQFASADFTASPKATVIAGLMKSSDTGGVQAHIALDAAAGSFFVGNSGGAGSDKVRIDLYDGTDSASGQTPAASADIGVGYVLSALLDRSQATVEAQMIARINGVEQTMSSAGLAGNESFGSGPLTFGAFSPASNFFHGREYGSIVISGAVDLVQLAKAERLMASRMGVSL